MNQYLEVVNRMLVNGLAILSVCMLLVGVPIVSAESAESESYSQFDIVVVNVNTASADELASTLFGIGMAKAEAIVQWRELNGQFNSVDELVEVRGIGTKTIERNRAKIEL